MIGIIASIPGIILNLILVQLGFSVYYDFQISGSIYLQKYLTYTFGGFLFGGLVWEFTAAGLGIITVYFIKRTGRTSWWIKGPCVSMMVFLAVYGYLYALGGPTIVPWDLMTNWALIVDHIVFGLNMGFLAFRWVKQ